MTQTGTTLALPAIMDIQTCGPLLDTLLAAMPSSPELQVSCNPVERIATPGVQLLLSLIKTSENNGKPVRLIQPSPSLMQAIGDLGLAEVFQPYLDFTPLDHNEAQP